MRRLPLVLVPLLHWTVYRDICTARGMDDGTGHWVTEFHRVWITELHLSRLKG